MTKQIVEPVGGFIKVYQPTKNKGQEIVSIPIFSNPVPEKKIPEKVK